MIEIFTSFNKTYYDLLASESLASWLANVTGDFKITVYREDQFDLPDDPRIEVIDWDQTVAPAWRTFCDQRRKTVDDKREIKFAKKGMTWCYHLEHGIHERFMWLDADVFCILPIDISYCQQLVDDHMIALFDVSHHKPKKRDLMPGEIFKPILSAETGFVVVNRSHEKFFEFSGTYRRFYHDCVAPDTCVKFYDGEVCRASVIGLEDHVRWLEQEIVGKRVQTPIRRHTVLGQHFEHFKANSKWHYDNLAAYWREGEPLNYNPDRIK